MDNTVKIPTNVSFGLTFAGFFGVVFLISWLSHDVWHASRWLLGSLCMLLISYICPKLLTPFNWAWFKLGQVLHVITTPLIMGLVFYLVVTPMAMVRRAIGQDPLRLRYDSKAHTYWVARQQLTAAEQLMQNQF